MYARYSTNKHSRLDSIGQTFCYLNYMKIFTLSDLLCDTLSFGRIRNDVRLFSRLNSVFQTISLGPSVGPSVRPSVRHKGPDISIH